MPSTFQTHSFVVFTIFVCNLELSSEIFILTNTLTCVRANFNNNLSCVSNDMIFSRLFVSSGSLF